MLKQTIDLTMPLTIISFFTVTRYYYAFVEDIGDIFFYGFPLPFNCKGFHTSLSEQFFIIPFVIDFMVYFAGWFIVISTINYFRKSYKVHRLVAIPLKVMAIVVLLIAVLFIGRVENMFKLTRDFEMEIKYTGVDYIWSVPERPE